ncbi:DsbA family protein [Nonomuraea sp. MCN248]|uniref:DsbA family protein n=1 Tax=Nonomuraea corallina TaxID=2989783 RepID=A0ABT4S5P1_9ACTN|nr:DsbA family protein [Nonomuraea corallina]MDA0632507.1 DsbA family protein [Nonomuraea corallina]
MRIEIWADVVCGWAYIGKRRVEKAVEGLDVEVVWRPFRIDPMAPAQAVPHEEAMADPMADDALRRCAPGLTPGENRVRMSLVAAEEGFGWTWGPAWRADSHDAHRLIALALEHGGPALQDAVAERVMKAHFLDKLDISDRATLHRLAAESGFAAAGALLDAGEGDELVRELLLKGKAIGVTTSPTIVAGSQALAGAQPPEVIREFVLAATPARPLPAEVERYRHAESLLDQRDPLGALVMLKPLLGEHGDDRNVLLLTGRAYYLSAQLGRARETLERLVAAAPDDAYARHLLGRTLQRQGHADEAAPHLRMAAAMAPEYA